MLGVGVEFLERLGPVQEQVQEHGVGHQFGDLPDGSVLNLEGRETPQQLQHYQQNGRARAECRRQELRRQDGAVPVGPRRQSVVEKRGHGVNPHRHRHAQQHQRNNQPLDVGLAVKRAVQNVRSHGQVHREIQVQHQHVPRQNAAREVQKPERRYQVPETVGPPDIHQHEHQAHGDGADGQQLAVNHDLANGLPVVNVCRDHQHHRGRGHSHQEREVADIEAPAYLVAHSGHAQAEAHLPGVRQGAGDDQRPQERNPPPVRPVPP